MPLVFQNVDNPNIRDAYSSMYACYPQLAKSKVIIQRKSLAGVTMRALPQVKSFLFGRQKTFVIQVSYHIRDSQIITVDDLPLDVLKGWAAHELGHVVDYLHRGFIEMLWYGFKYWSSSHFARKVEHEADRIAVRHGLLKFLLATKEFLFLGTNISEGYKKRLSHLYMSIDEVKLCVPDNQRVL